MAKNFMFDANNSTLSVMEELVEGQVPTEGIALVTEPNSIDNFGNSTESTTRNPLSTSRDAKKGTITSLNSSVEISQDLTVSSYREFMSGALSANWTGITNMKLFNRSIEDVKQVDNGMWQFRMKVPLANLPTTATLISYDFLDERRNGVLEIKEVTDGAIKIVDAVNKGFGITGNKSNLDPNGRIMIEWEPTAGVSIDGFGGNMLKLELPEDIVGGLEVGADVVLEDFAKEENNGTYKVEQIDTASNTVRLYPPLAAIENALDEITMPGKTFDIYSGALTGDNAETVDITISAAGTYNITIGSITSTASGSKTIQIQANGADIVNQTQEFSSAGATLTGLTFTHNKTAGQEQITAITLVGTDLSATDVVITYKEDDTKRTPERRVYVSYEAKNWVNYAEAITIVPMGLKTINGIVYLSGYKNPNNNGVKYLIEKPVDGEDGYFYFLSDKPMINESMDFSQKETPIVQWCGFRIETDSNNANIDEQGNITYTNISSIQDVLDMKLKGQAIWIGTQDPNESFNDPEANGLARISRVDNDKIYLDKRNLSETEDGLPYVFTPEAEGSKKSIPLFFGEFLRTYEVGDNNYKRKSYSYELKTTNDAGISYYEYSVGNLINTLTLGLPSQEKATLDVSNVSRIAQDATTTPLDWDKREPKLNKAMSTPSDVLTCRVNKLDDSGLATLWVDATLEINNNVNQEYAIGSLSPVAVAQGQFDINLSGNVFYQNPNVASAITNNCTVSADIFLTNEDGGIFIDMPSAFMSDGSRDFTNNEKIKQSLTVTAYKENEWGYSISSTLFPYLPLEKTDACK